MNVAEAAAEVLKREGVETLLAYPLNSLIEAAAAVDIRTIVVRQERTGIHMADAISRITSGDKVGVFCMQTGPGTENSFGAVAQAYSEAVPLGRDPRRRAARNDLGQARIQRRAQFPAYHQGRRAGDERRRYRAGAAPRLHPGAERSAGAGAGRDPAGHVDGGADRAGRLQAGPPGAFRAGRERGRCRRRDACFSPSGR